LLIRKAGPFVPDSWRELGRHLLHLVHRLAGAYTWGGLPQDLDRWEAVVPLQAGGAVLPAGGGKGGKRHHLAVLIADVPAVDVLRQHPGAWIGLEIDLLHPAVLNEVVDVSAPPGGGEDVVYITQRDPDSTGPDVIDIKLELGRIVLAIGAHSCQFRVLHCHAEQLIARFHQLLMTYPSTVLQLEVEAVGHPQFQDRRRGEGKGEAVTDLRKRLHRSRRNGRYFQVRGFAHIPIPELHPC